MYNTSLSVIWVLLFTLQLGICLKNEQQSRYNQNTDFLLHETSGQGLSSGKRDATSSQSLISISQQNSAQPITSPKRDYVNPNFQNTHLATGQKGFVTPSSVPTSASTVNAGQTPIRRDFVNPRFTTAKPPQDNSHKESGQVHDLISFFDSKGNNGNVTPKPPSYSSILQGTTKHSSVASTASPWGSSKVSPSPPVTQSTVTSPQTPKSFSSVVSGSDKQTTNQQTSNHPNVIPSRGTTVTSRPVTPKLPSAILNNNNNNPGFNSFTDAEIQSLSEELLRKDTNNAARYITINYQEKTTSQTREDKAPLPLLTVTPAVWNIPTIQKFVPLLDNYEKDTSVNEYVTPQERNEENAFMDAIMSTTVIRHLMNFLKNKGYVTPDPRQQRDFLKQLWFGLYSRGKGKISSSGFEHIFLSEHRNNEVLGLHNWIYFAREEAANRANYLGYLKYVALNDKGAVLKLHFTQNGLDKPVDSMFIGTSPELEIALYTLCFMTRANDECKLKLNNKDVKIISHTFRYRSKDFIGSAYPQI